MAFRFQSEGLCIYSMPFQILEKRFHYLRARRLDFDTHEPLEAKRVLQNLHKNKIPFGSTNLFNSSLRWTSSLRRVSEIKNGILDLSPLGIAALGNEVPYKW